MSVLLQAPVGIAQVHQAVGFADAALDLARDGQRLLQILDCRLVPAHVVMGDAYVVENDSLAGAVPHLAMNRQRLLVVLECLVVAVHLVVDDGHVRERQGLVQSILRFAMERRRLQVVLERLFVTVEGPVGIRQTIEVGRLPGTAFHLPVDGQRLLEDFDSLLRPTARAVRNAQVVHGKRLVNQIIEPFSNRDCLLQHVDGPVGATKVVVSNPHVVEHDALRGGVADLAEDGERAFVPLECVRRPADPVMDPACEIERLRFPVAIAKLPPRDERLRVQVQRLLSPRSFGQQRVAFPH